MAKILIIDDEESNRMLLRDVLRTQGHEVVEASDGEEGIQQFRKSKPDLVITDLVMPNMDGFETIKRIHRESPTTKVLTYTAFDENDEKGWVDLAQELGASNALHVPLDVREIENSVRELLGGSPD